MVVTQDIVFVALVALVALVAFVAVAALPEMLMPQVPDAPVPVGDGTSEPIARPKLVLAVDAEVAPVPPLATGRAPDTSEVSTTCAKDVFVPSDLRTRLAVCAGAKALKAAFAVVCPVPPLAMAKVPVKLAASIV